MATVAAADLLVLLVQRRWSVGLDGWQSALLGALLLALVLAVPLYWLLRTTVRACELDARQTQALRPPAPAHQRRLRAVLYGICLLYTSARWLPAGCAA